MCASSGIRIRLWASTVNVFIVGIYHCEPNGQERSSQKISSQFVSPLGQTDDGAHGVTRPTNFKDLIIAGPAPAPLLRAETFYRYQIMLRTRAMSALSRELARLIQSLALPEDVTLAVDIDPVNLT